MPGMDKTMHEFKHGTLKSGSGHKVTSRKQAIAIGLSGERKAGHKVPPPPSDHARQEAAGDELARIAGVRRRKK